MKTRGTQVQNWLNGFQRAYTHSLRYFRALRVMDRVVDAVLALGLSKQCQTSLMRMTRCSQCAGVSALPCNRLCLNTLRGCLVDLGDLVEPIREFSQALIRMEEQARSYSLYSQITLLSSYFFQTVSDTRTDFITEVHKCHWSVV